MGIRSMKEIEGTFRGVVRSFIIGESAEKRTPGVDAMFEIVSEGEHKGEFVPWNSYFAGKNEERLVESLMFLGWDGVKPIHTLTPEDLANETDIVVEMDKYMSPTTGQERRYPKVAWVNGPRGVGVKEMGASESLAFSERMKQLAAGLKVKKAAAASADPTSFPHGAQAPAPQLPAAQAAAGGRKF